VGRRQAELEQKVRRALWRMDVKLMPLLAQEAARPYSVYRPLYVPSVAEGQGVTQVRPSPLLTRPRYVLLNFQFGPDNQWTSPQAPQGADQQIAVRHGVAAGELQLAERRLAGLSQRITYERFVERLPSQWLPVAIAPQPGKPDNEMGAAESYGPVIKNAAELGQSAGPTSQPTLPIVQSAPAPQRAKDNAMLPSVPPRGAGDVELQVRDAAVQAYAQNVLAIERTGRSARESVREGVSQPLWVGPDLLLARRVMIDGEMVIQGCWLDWPQMKVMLIHEVADLLPQADLLPVTEAVPRPLNRMLAGLPVQLVTPSPGAASAGWTAIRISLLVAWGCLLLAVAAVAILFRGVLALGERREAFVSSVTHELRTPLTTFRMYSEMLAEDMVADPDRRRQYLETLCVEADRLFHLVENVLSYARLERGRERPQRQRMTVDALLERVEARLTERARQSGMQLAVEHAGDVGPLPLSTDAGAVEQILFNLVDNACKYASTASDPRIHLSFSAAGRELRIQVRDHGRGISAAQARRLFRPFSKSAAEAAASAPGVGLGLALSRRLAKDLGGRLVCETTAGEGAAFLLALPLESAPA
jgi:signal transduction histidine kinase